MKELLFLKLKQKHYQKGVRKITFWKLLLATFFMLFIGTAHATNDEAVQQQRRTITGVVTELNGAETLPGVNISIKGTTQGTISDADGKYELAVESNTAVLVFQFIGKKTYEVTVQNRTVINVDLEDDAIALGEVVIYTGYMVQKKADLTGSLALATAKDLEQNQRANAMSSLQGKLPGVSITGSGSPTEDLVIRVRGYSSIPSDYRATNPATLFRSTPNLLIVIDGYPTDFNLRDINALDIESIQILKDASSASIYGSRAAAGVILIETKKGTAGRSSIRYDGSVAFSTIADKPDVMNAQQYGQAIWQATVNDYSDPAGIRYYNFDWYRGTDGIPVLNSVTPVPWLNDAMTMPSADTDWFDEIGQTGVAQNHQITISSGSDKGRNLFSLNYYDRKGTVIESYFKRYSFRANSDVDLLDGRLKVGENFTMTYLTYSGSTAGTGNVDGYYYNAMILPPIIPMWCTDGMYGGTAMAYGMDDYNNPYRSAKVDHADNPRHQVRAVGSAYLDLAILSNLHFKSQFGVNYQNQYRRTITRKWQEGGGRANNRNGITNEQRHYIDYTWTNTLTYNLKLKDHSLDVVLGQEAMHWQYDRFQSYRDDIFMETRDFAYLDVAAGSNRTQEGNGDEYALLSFFGKANYSYQSKYLLSATLRYDGSSRFGQNNRYGTFPAFSGAWRISSESFMQELTWLSDLKLRASWGVNGSQVTNSNAIWSLYASNYNNTAYGIAGNSSGSLMSGFQKSRIGNPDLQWESTIQSDFGFDFSLLNNKWNGSFSYYLKDVKDMLFQPTAIGTMGEGSDKYVNAAHMSNKGFELMVNYNNTLSSGFRYSITATAGAYRNKVISVPESSLNSYGGNGMNDNILGRPIGSWYGLVADGIFKTQEEVDNHAEQTGKGLGRIRYKDLDGDGRIDDNYDKTWLGSPHPDFDAGMNFELSYKGFDLTAYFQGVFGTSVYNAWKQYTDFWNTTVQNDKNHLARVLDAWSLTNQNSNIPALSRQDQNQEARLSSYYIENASYIKMRTLELGYNLPGHIASKFHAQRLRVYVSGHNLLRFNINFTGPDAENPGNYDNAQGYEPTSYAHTKDVTFGLNVTF